MYLLIADELKNRGAVVYNPFHYGTKPARYVLPLPLEFSTPIDEISVEDYLISCEDRISETLAYINEHSSLVSNDSIYFEIFAEDSFYNWTADIYFDDLQAALYQVKGKKTTLEVLRGKDTLAINSKVNKDGTIGFQINSKFLVLLDVS